MMTATLKQIGCPVCREEMHEENERYCESCGRKICTGCAITFDINDKIVAPGTGFYHVCTECRLPPPNAA